jgi:hypothetical protein
LSFIYIFNPGETVIDSLILHPYHIHLARKPFPAVQADVDGERKPGLYPSTHEAKHGIYPVMIDMQAPPLFRFKYQFLSVAVPSSFIAYARLDTAQKTDQPIGDFVFVHDLFC